ncbi:hypothetical protein [Paenibacillus dauci]|uniref:hypothetical protein n=1 Tax=Paenibacillus dauci TaxID=1567106 RepID=UPI000619739A|nr:hypothetical protein [Paenibacillus dauci]
MSLSDYLRKNKLECTNCNQELNVVGFGSGLDKLKCFHCNRYYKYTIQTKILVQDLRYAELVEKWDTGSGEWPGIPSSEIYSPWYLKKIVRMINKRM